MDAKPPIFRRFQLRGTAISLALSMALTAPPALHASPSAEESEAWTSLGEALFFDASLSADGRVACASCHQPELAFTDAEATSVGVFGRRGSRNAPSLLDLDSVTAFFWEGRTESKEAAMTDAFFNPHEMGLEHMDDLLRRLAASRRYGALIQALPESARSFDRTMIARAIEAFLASQSGRSSPFDRFMAGREDALSEQAKRGLAVFRGKARCSECHALDSNPPPLTDHRFHHTGVGFGEVASRLPEIIQRYRDSLETTPPGAVIIGDADIAELGRYLATGRTADLGAFRTPSLRNVARTAPYMHNGSIATLPEALDREVYYRSITSGQPVSLTLREREDLLAFLESLSDEEDR